MLKIYFIVLSFIFSTQYVLAETSATATADFSLTIPASVVLYDGPGTNNDTFPVMIITQNESTGQMTGTTNLTWNLISNSSKGAQVATYLSSLSAPSDFPNLKNNITLQVVNANGEVPITVDNSFGVGVPLGLLPTSVGSALNMCHISSAGHGIYTTKLNLNAAPISGSGIITGLLVFIATMEN